MANSMNNWLGFSLSSKQLHHHHHHQDHSQNSVSELGFNSDEQVADECFDLTSHSTINPLTDLPPPPFAIFEAFSRNPQSSQEKDVSMSSCFSCSTHNTHQNQETPKLENFLGVGGGHSFTDNHNQQHSVDLQSNGRVNSYDIYQESEAIAHANMGLSVIKNWLRNHPVPPHAAEDNEVATSQGPALAGAQTLSLSMSTGSQSSDNKLQAAAVESQNSGGGGGGGGAIESVPRKSIDTFGQRTSIYRGVTRHRWTGRYEAHLWDNSCRREGQSRKGRQVYLGGYDKEEKAARAYDLAALKYWGTTTTTNFPISNYEKELEEMKHMTRQEYIASLRRKSSGFSRGASIYRGVTRHHQHGRWQARIGRVAGNKDLYLGTFSTEAEAAEAYDIAAIKFRGLNAVTNFEISRYDVKSIMESSALPIRGGTKRLKDAENAETALQMHRANEVSLNLQLTDQHTNGYGNGNGTHGWPAIAFQAQPLSIYPYAHERMWCKQEQVPDVGHGFSDIHHHHQLQLGNNQTFLQPSLMHNLMSLDSSSVELSSCSSSIAYGNEANGSVPIMGRVIAQDGNQNQINGFVGNDEEKGFGYEGMFVSTDADRNLYYQPSSNGIAKAASVYNEQGSTFNNWIPSAVPSVAARANTMAVCHGASTFTVWNDT